MKRKWKPRGSDKKKKSAGVLQKYMVAVGDFVKSKSGEGEAENDAGFRSVKRKSRKEMRKEKRKLKKARMKSHYQGKQTNNLAIGGDTQTVTALKQKNKMSKTNAKQPENQKIAQKKTSKLQELKKKKLLEVNKQDDIQKVPKTNDKSKVAPNKTNKLQESRKKALLEANEQEDREIKKLERYLKLNKRKNKKSLPQSFVADGLDYILGALDADTLATGMYDSDDNMDVAKDNFEQLNEDNSDQDEEDLMSEGEDVNDEGEEEGEEDADVEEDADEEEDPSEEEDAVDEELEDKTDNDEEAEEASESSSINAPSATGKYVPPQMRDAGGDQRKAELEKLKKNVKGLVNRLSEPNMSSISSQLEALYMSHSRKDMNETLTEVLLAACVTPALMPDRLLMEHILLVSILHHAVGLEVGAHFLETVVRQFDDTYKQPSEGKECDNLVAIVAHLYNFQVVHSLLIFDILQRLVAAFTEKDIELVLFVLRNVGFSLRKDDALALKELITEAQRKAADVGKKFQDQTRVRFMLETMLALKNNDMRKIPGYDPEPVEKLKKLQRTLIQRSTAGSDMKLRVSLENLLSADQVGRWWIVGSSWSGAPMISNQESKGVGEGQFQFTTKVLELARKQRMNTEVRRNIFCVIMTSEDYIDAFDKLLRMGLKDKQEREIVHVLMDCCLQEKTFNSFYAVLGEKFCAHDRRFQMTFQFTLWDKFRELSNLPARSFNNVCQLVTRFLQNKCLSLSLLKAIEFGELDKPTVRFLRQVLTRLLTDTEPEDLVSIFARISGIPQLAMLREGLKLFISHFLLKNAGPQDDVLKERACIATKAMDSKEARVKL
ncbi:nucleolar MIF4G domain-containing protein 1 [Corythoichthys intestinalis]|uniref:nucleolar MIF4G domain-containing protein 1 n=1 Tax=Corythoichthys intestinalis TaxID=161448 RepID=UPI0025A54383|nr:nucleolar MIF4G domain-containing protein 1 [Corythoichthys intestinalis]